MVTLMRENARKSHQGYIGRLKVSNKMHKDNAEHYVTKNFGSVYGIKVIIVIWWPRFFLPKDG